MRTDIGIYLSGVRSAARLPLRLFAMVAVLLTATLSVVATGLPEGLSTRVILCAGLVLWFVWSVTGGVILRAPLLSFSGLPVRACAAHGTKRFASHFGAPFIAVFGTAGLLAIVYCLCQVVRIPAIGWPLLVLLLPLLLVLAFGAVRLFLRWLAVGALVGPSIAEGTADAYRGLFRAQAFWKAGPWRVLFVRLSAFVTWLIDTLRHLLLYALALGAIWLVLGLLRGEPQVELERAVRNGLAGDGLPGIAALGIVALLLAFAVSRPVVGFFGARAAAYLVLRRDLDDIPVDAPVREESPEKSLEELGIELVSRLQDELEED